jgi:hypothetical protein
MVRTRGRPTCVHAPSAVAAMSARHRKLRSTVGPANTEISCEDCGILAGAGFVSFISLFDGALILERHVFDDLPKAYPASLLTDDALCPNARDDRAAIVPNGDPSFVS